MELKSYWRTSAAVFALAGAALFWTCADRLTLNVDEGIYLEGSLRVMQGESPYRDFFDLVGPGTYWLYGGVFRLFGPTLQNARIPLIVEVAAITTVVFFLTAQLTSYIFALATVLVFFAFETHDLSMIALNHRWDSSALAFMALAPAYTAIRTDSRSMAMLSGTLAAAGTWCTPTLGLVALVIVVWMLANKELRWLTLPFLLGMTIVSAICMGILIWEQALIPMIEHFRWTAVNYSGVNHVPYGWAGTGYGEIASGLGIAGLIVYGLVLIVVAAPAALPIVSWLSWAVYFSRRKATIRRESSVLFLIACSVVLVASTYPRWDMGHLLYVAPISYVLAASLLHRILPAKVAPVLFALLAFVSIFLWAPGITGFSAYRPLETPVGLVRVQPEDAKLINLVMNRVTPGDGLFVFPYFPTFYFLTRGVNPTKFAYLQPGQMTDADEAMAIKDLIAHPPMWVCYNRVSPEMYLQHWPSSDPTRLRFPAIEDYLAANYTAVGQETHRFGEFSLLQRK